MEPYRTIAAADVKPDDRVYDSPLTPKAAAYFDRSPRWVRVRAVRTVGAYAVLKLASGVELWRDPREGVAVAIACEGKGGAS